nr:MAG TPA: hypothetical protein [Caudoviricetes sp.]
MPLLYASSKLRLDETLVLYQNDDLRERGDSMAYLEEIERAVNEIQRKK